MIVLALVAVCGYFGGVLWACIGANIGCAIHMILTIVLAGRATGFDVGAYLAGCARPLLPCLPMVVAAVGIERLLIGMAMPQVAILALQVIGGASGLRRRRVAPRAARSRRPHQDGPRCDRSTGQGRAGQ